MRSIDRRFDAIVIGSGAGGSAAVKELTERGLAATGHPLQRFIFRRVIRMSLTMGAAIVRRRQDGKRPQDVCRQRRQPGVGHS